MIKLQDILFKDLLPSSINKDSTIQALSQALDYIIKPIHNHIDKLYLWSRIDELEEPLLTELARQSSLINETVWLLAESTTAKRELLKRSAELHKYKGTPWAIRELVRALGFGEISIIEGSHQINYDGTKKYNGVYIHGDLKAWAQFRVVLNRPITIEQSILLKKAILEYSPARCELSGLDFRAAPIRYNANAKYDKTYNHGSN